MDLSGINRLVSGFGTETLYILYLSVGCVVFCDVANTSLMAHCGNPRRTNDETILTFWRIFKVVVALKFGSFRSRSKMDHRLKSQECTCLKSTDIFLNHTSVCPQ
jgi:hypothetical protein